MGTFKRGFEQAKEEKQKQDERREKYGKKLFNFFLAKDGDEANVVFLTTEPINSHQHNIKTVRAGKERYESITCRADLGESCKYCEQGDKPQFKGTFLIVDLTPYTSTKGDKKTITRSVKTYTVGTKILLQLDRIAKKYGLNRTITVERIGKGTDTTYTFQTGEPTKFTQQEITDMLPEKLRSSYNGTLDSLYSIVEDQVAFTFDEDSDDEDSAPAPAGKTRSVDEDEEDDVPFDVGVKTEEKAEPPKRPTFRSLRKN